MEILKEALERNGFEYTGPCKICGGRGFEYKLEGVNAKIKKDMQGRELHIMFSGRDLNGRRIVPTKLDRKIDAHIENIDTIIQRTIGRDVKEETGS